MVTAAITIAVLALLSFVFVRQAITPAQVVEQTDDGRLLVTAAQPKVADWNQSLVAEGLDVSFPQCKRSLPKDFEGFIIVGLNYGKPFSQNPCFARQWKWATTHAASAIYINVADPGKISAKKYGQQVGNDTVKRMKKYSLAKGTPVWLDIETYNTWTQPYRSVEVINATMKVITAAGYPVGIYSTPAHWFEITLNAVIDVPVWLAIGKFSSTQAGFAAAGAACQRVTFGDKTPALVQFVTKRKGALLDHNLVCAKDLAGLARAN